MITAKYKQKENKPKEVSPLRHDVAHYLLGKRENKKAVRGSVQAESGSPWCRPLCLHLHCRTHLTPELIPIKLPTNSVQKGDICFEQRD